MKKISLLLISAFLSMATMAQNYQSAPNSSSPFLKAGTGFTIPKHDTLSWGFTTADSVGSILYRPADNRMYLKTPTGSQKIPVTLDFLGVYINNSATLQSGAVFNVERALINQAALGTTTTALPAAAAVPFTLAGGKGMSTTASTGTVIAGRAADIAIRPGQGGDQNTAGASFGGGGRGGNIDITAGNGGLGNGSGMISGNGGTMTVQGGDAGPVGTGAISGEAGLLKLAGGSANPGSNGNGKSVFIIPGAGYGTGFHGDTYIGTSPALVYRGRALVGFTDDPSLIPTKQIFQVNGTSWFKDTVTLSNIASKILKTDASGNVIPAVAGTDYLTSVSSGNLSETGSSVLTITGGTGAVLGSGTTLQVKQATTSQNGFITSADWNTFNNRVPYVRSFTFTAGNSGISVTPSTAQDFTINRTVSISNAGVLSVNGSSGAITIDTSSIASFNVKVRSLFSGTAPMTYANGLIGITQSSTGTNGYLSSTDWNTFNGKASAFTTGNLTETGSSVLTITGGTGAQVGGNTTLQVKQAATGQSGFLSNTDWNTFNSKLSSVDTTNIASFNVKVRSLFSGTAPVTYLNGAIGITQATTGSNGYLSSTDWNTFNGKLNSFGTQTANTIYAGPTTGTAATPAFRALVAADIPTLAAYIQNQNGAAQTTSNFWISGNGRIDGTFVTTGAAPTFTALATGGMLKSNTSGQLQIAVSGTDYAPASGSSAYAPITGGSNYIQNQNSSAQSSSNLWISGNVRTDGTSSIFGSASNTQSLVQIKSSAGGFNLQTDNSGNNGTTNLEWLLFGSGNYLNVQDVTGNVGIGVTAPTVKLDVNGTGRFATSVITPTLSVSGGVRMGIRSTAVNTTLASTDYTLICTASGLTITLGAASGYYLSNTGGQIFIIANRSTSGVATLSTAFTSLTNVSTTTIAFGKSVMIQSDGTNWNEIK